MQRVAYKDRPLCFLDIESTGLEAGHHEVTEISFIHEKLGSLCIRITPRYLHRAQEKAIEISGFNAEDWAGEPDMERAVQTIAKFMSGTIPAGHNIGGFDLPFLRGDIDAKGLNSGFIPYSYIDTQVLAVSHLVNHGLSGASLAACCDYFGISNDGAHNSYDDTLRAKKVYEGIMGCLKWIGTESQQELF